MGLITLSIPLTTTKPNANNPSTRPIDASDR
jgi:hypothetical protein